LRKPYLLSSQFVIYIWTDFGLKPEALKEAKVLHLKNLKKFELILGFHSGIQPEIAERANVLIFLDIPLGERLRNHFWRMFEHTSRHKELSIWDDMTFFIEIIQRALRKKTKYLELLGQYPKKAIVLRSRKEIDSYLNSL
jgi:hypothetical protein